MVISERDIVVFATGPFLQRGIRLAADLGLSLVNKLPAEAAFMLMIDQHGVSITRTATTHQPLRVNFTSPSMNYRRRFGGGRGQAIARAVGLKGGSKPRVLDATAGLGRDSFILASLGCSVTLIERHIIVAALLSDGLHRGSGQEEISPVIKRMSLNVTDAQNWISDHDGEGIDVIYIDPMFPPRTKSALVKGDMQLLHDLVGVDEDVELLLSTALRSNASRVVVKRPKRSANVAGFTPGFVLQGKSSRFDVYI
jgi:16S rRNA (guanine1516-N2)-methyltransferase